MVVEEGEGLRVCRLRKPFGVGVGDECRDASDSTSVVVSISSSSNGRLIVEIESGGVGARGPGDEEEVRLVDADIVYRRNS